MLVISFFPILVWLRYFITTKERKIEEINDSQDNKIKKKKWFNLLSQNKWVSLVRQASGIVYLWAFQYNEAVVFWKLCSAYLKCLNFFLVWGSRVDTLAPQCSYKFQVLYVGRKKTFPKTSAGPSLFSWTQSKTACLNWSQWQWIKKKKMQEIKKWDICYVYYKTDR